MLCLCISVLLWSIKPHQLLPKSADIQLVYRIVFPEEDTPGSG